MPGGAADGGREQRPERKLHGSDALAVVVWLWGYLVRPIDYRCMVLLVLGILLVAPLTRVAP
jgi:hypothetical protein